MMHKLTDSFRKHSFTAAQNKLGLRSDMDQLYNIIALNCMSR